MSFLSRGFDHVDKDVQELTDRREKMAARRVWVKSNSSITAVFLDEQPVRFEEYRIWKGKRPDFVTRPPAGQRDRFLAAGLKADPKFAWTVIDLSTWKDKKGQEHKNEKKLLVVNADIAKLLRDKAASWGGLKHKAVIIRRKGDKDSNSGSDFELMIKNGVAVAVNMKAFKDVDPFNYEKILAPPSDDESIRILAQLSKANQNNEAVAIEDDDPGAGDTDAPATGELPGGSGPAEMDSSASDINPF